MSLQWGIASEESLRESSGKKRNTDPPSSPWVLAGEGGGGGEVLRNVPNNHLKKLHSQQSFSLSLSLIIIIIIIISQLLFINSPQSQLYSNPKKLANISSPKVANNLTELLTTPWRP